MQGSLLLLNPTLQRASFASLKTRQAQRCGFLGCERGSDDFPAHNVLPGLHIFHIFSQGRFCMTAAGRDNCRQPWVQNEYPVLNEKNLPGVQNDSMPNVSVVLQCAHEPYCIMFFSVFLIDYHLASGFPSVKK